MELSTLFIRTTTHIVRKPNELRPDAFPKCVMRKFKAAVLHASGTVASAYSAETIKHLPSTCAHLRRIYLS